MELQDESIDDLPFRLKDHCYDKESKSSGRLTRLPSNRSNQSRTSQTRYRRLRSQSDEIYAVCFFREFQGVRQYRVQSTFRLILLLFYFLSERRLFYNNLLPLFYPSLDFSLRIFILFRCSYNNLGVKFGVGVIGAPAVPIQVLVYHVNICAARANHFDIFVLFEKLYITYRP